MGAHSFEHAACLKLFQEEDSHGGQKEFEMERAVTEAELSCRAQTVRGESYIVQSSIEISWSHYSNDKRDYTLSLS